MMKNAIAILSLLLLAQGAAAGEYFQFINKDKRHFTKEIMATALNQDDNPELEDYRGKVVVLIFWALWCKPSQKEIKPWVEIYKKYHGQGVEFIVLADEAGRLWSKPKYLDCLKDNHMDFPVAMSTRLTLAQYHIDWLPTVFFFDRTNRLAARYIDREYKPEKHMSETIEKLLKEN